MVAERNYLEYFSIPGNFRPAGNKNSPLHEREHIKERTGRIESGTGKTIPTA
jgi:hypothetical protein